MDGYCRFQDLTLQSWERVFIVQDISPLVRKNELEVYFKQFGEIERVWFIHSPEDGCFMKKALVLMKSPKSAALIINKIDHRICTDEISEDEIGMDLFVTTVKYRGSVKIYPRGLYKLYLVFKMPWNQDSEDDRTLMGLFLTREIVRAYSGLIFTSINLYKDQHLKYTGFVCIRFEHKSDEEIVLERTKERLDVSFGSWRDAEDKDFWRKPKKGAEGVSEEVKCDKVGDDSNAKSGEERVLKGKKEKLRVPAMWRDKEHEDFLDTEFAEGASEMVECDKEGNVLDFESDEEGDVLDDEGDEEGDEEGSINSDGDW